MDTEAKSPIEKKKKSVISAKRLDRAFKVFDLRKNGGSFRAISQTLKKQAEDAGESTRGFSHTQCKADYELAVAVKIEDLTDMVTSARVLTAERIDDVILRIAPLLNSGKPNTKLKAAGVLIRANKEYAELHGAKRPTKIEVTNEDGSPLMQPIAEAITSFEKNLLKVYDDDSDSPESE